MRTSIEEIRRAIEDPRRTVDVCSVLLDAWFEAAPRRLGEALSKFRAKKLENHECVEKFERTFKNLDPAARRRLLGSPWVSGFMDDPDGVSHEDPDGRPVSTIEALHLAARAECQISPNHEEAGGLHHGKEVESPLGEWVVRQRDFGFEKVERAKVGGVIALDVDSGLARRNEPESGTFCNPFMSISPEELVVIQEKLEAAIELVDKVTPHLGLLIRIFTRRVFVRKSIQLGDQVSPLNLGSEYRPIHVGCIRILNDHRPEMPWIFAQRQFCMSPYTRISPPMKMCTGSSCQVQSGCARFHHGQEISFPTIRWHTRFLFTTPSISFSGDWLVSAARLEKKPGGE